MRRSLLSPRRRARLYLGRVAGTVLSIRYITRRRRAGGKSGGESNPAFPRQLLLARVLIPPAAALRIGVPGRGRAVGSGGDTFLLEAWFLREVVELLTPTGDEHLRFLTGPKLGRLRVVCRCAPEVPLERQNIVAVRASALAVARALIPIIEEGGQAHVFAHSHPGMGPGATGPSGTDITTLGRLQSDGCPAIGLIVTRDGYARFFTVHKPFRVVISGNGVTKLDNQLFHLHDEDSD
jgi:hypothetical protein